MSGSFYLGFFFQDNKTLKPGCWPRPPVNYCILISLALKNSHTGSLKVQQIYNFTRSGFVDLVKRQFLHAPWLSQHFFSFLREHFPFFQTAPDGWKNTIRHNLCFNNSFRKTCNQLCRDGKRKSCFWHLTLDGHRRLKDEIHMLTGESLRQLERSMSHPGKRVPTPDHWRNELLRLITDDGFLFFSDIIRSLLANWLQLQTIHTNA